MIEVTSPRSAISFALQLPREFARRGLGIYPTSSQTSSGFHQLPGSLRLEQAVIRRLRFVAESGVTFVTLRRDDRHSHKQMVRSAL